MKRKLFNEAELFKNMIGGVEEITKEATTETPQSSRKMNTGLIIFIGIVVVIVVIVIIIIILFNVQGGPIHERRKNFNNLRCRDPLIINFPGFFSPGPMTFQQNKSFCDAETLQDANKKNMLPMQNQLNSITKFNEKIRNQIDNQTKMIYHMRQNIEKQGREVMQKLYNLYARLAYVFKVFARLFYRIFQVFRDIFTTLKYAIWTLTSIWNGPLGRTMRFFCFGEETILKINRNNKTILSKINEIQIGDTINDTEVIGLCQFLREKDNQIYKLNNINVSGTHLIEYNNKIIRVKDHPDATPIQYNSQFLYSLITNNGLMKINDNKFRDHLGDNTIDTYKVFVKTIYKNDLNIIEDPYINNAINLYPGFTYNSFLKTNKGIVMAEEIKIGDIIGNKKVMGIVKYKLEGKTFITNYNLDDKYSGFMVGIQFYKENEYVTKEHEERMILGKLDCIGLLIEGGIVEIKEDIKVADFEIVPDELREEAENNIA